MAHPNRDEALKTLQDKAQPLAQHFINMGHGIEREASKKAIADAEAAKLDAEGKVVEANKTIDQLRSEKPDLGALQTQHQKALETRDETHRKAMEAERNRTRSVLLERDLERVRSKLVAKRVDPELAKEYTDAGNASLVNRFKYDDQGNPTVFQAGSQVPYVVGNGQDLLDPLAEEILKRVPKRGFVDPDDDDLEISGHRSDAGGEGGKKGKKTVYDNIREDVQKQNENADATNLVNRRNQKFGSVASS